MLTCHGQLFATAGLPSYKIPDRLAAITLEENLLPQSGGLVVGLVVFVVVDGVAEVVEVVNVVVRVVLDDG